MEFFETPTHTHVQCPGEQTAQVIALCVVFQAIQIEHRLGLLALEPTSAAQRQKTVQDDVGHGNPLKDVEARLKQMADIGQIVLFVQQAGEKSGSRMASDRGTAAVRFCGFQGVAKDILRFTDAPLMHQAHAVDASTNEGPARRGIRAIAVLDDCTHSLVITAEQIQPGKNGGATGQYQIVGIVRYRFQFRSEAPCGLGQVTLHGQRATRYQQALTLLNIQSVLLRLQLVKYLLPFCEVMRMQL
ncbi:hypothetical protein D3C84_275540 [compost metagenome]